MRFSGMAEEIDGFPFILFSAFLSYTCVLVTNKPYYYFNCYLEGNIITVLFFVFDHFSYWKGCSLSFYPQKVIVIILFLWFWTTKKKTYDWAGNKQFKFITIPRKNFGEFSNKTMSNWTNVIRNTDQNLMDTIFLKLS